MTSPSRHDAAFALLSSGSPTIPGRTVSGTRADSAVHAQAIARAKRGDQEPLELWKRWQEASASPRPSAPRTPTGPHMLTMPDGYEGDDQHNAFWIWGPQSAARLPSMAGDVEVLPGYVTGKAQYDGDNASIAIGYELNPINAGVATKVPQDSTNGPGTRLCWYYIYCHQWEITAERTFSGIGGCGMNLTGEVTYKAWRTRYDIFAVDYNGGVTIGTNTGNYTSGYKYVFMPRSWGQIGHDGKPTDTGTKCETESCSIGTGTGETGGGVTGEASRIVAAPRFDCTFAVGSGGGWTTKVCITWETGYIDLSTGKRVVLATWVECYLLDENGGWLRVDRSGQAPTLDGDVPPLASPPSAAGAGAERRITIVGVNGLAGASPTRVVRRKRGPLTDAVLVDLARATPEDIASALAGLRVALAVQGDTAAAVTDGTIAFSDLGRGWAGDGRRRAADQLATLAAAPVREIAGLGRVHALEVYVTLPAVRRESRSAR